MCAQKLPLELSKVYAISPEVNQPTHPYEYRHGQIIATRSELRPLDYVPRRYIILRPRLFETQLNLPASNSEDEFANTKYQIKVNCKAKVNLANQMFCFQTRINSRPVSAQICAQKLPPELSKVYIRYLPRRFNQPTPTIIKMAKFSQLALNSVLLIMFLVGTSSSAPDYSSLSTRDGVRPDFDCHRTVADCEYAVCTRHATPDEFKDGKGADLMAKRAAHVRGDPGEVFNCVGESIKTKFANKVAERAYCCGREVNIHGNDDDVCSVPIYKCIQRAEPESQVSVAVKEVVSKSPKDLLAFGFKTVTVSHNYKHGKNDLEIKDAKM
ncbi:hypothetical protein H4Q26_014048 [Puccinia striiformis f. sp. tritici PST-130]|nr:hypothetical protein H4Q26_014048 [Puccinia striiformis f. sp. tritici PST-130]